MSDFDKILNDRLNEDDGEFFPRREANWEKLSERLAGFEAANPLPNPASAPALRAVWKRRLWTSAAAALIGVGGLLMWHFNDVKNMQQQNDRLQQEVAALKSSQQAGHAVANADNKTMGQSDVKTTVNPSPTASNSNNVATTTTANSPQTINSTPSRLLRDVPSAKTPVFEQKQTNQSVSKQNSAIADSKLNTNKTVGDKKQTANSIVNSNRNDNQLSGLNKKKTLDAVSFDKNQQPLDPSKATLKDNVAMQTDPSVSTSVLEANKTNTVSNKINETNLAPKVNEESIKTGTKEIETLGTVAQNVPTQNTETATATPNNTEIKTSSETAKIESTVVEATKDNSKTQVANPDTKLAAETATPPPPIIPVDKGWKRFQKLLSVGFALGLNGTRAAATPEIPGVEATTGKGASATLMLTKNFGLAVQGDLLETHFELHDRPKRFHLPDAPDPKKPNVGLHHIRGEQHSQMLSVNAKYVFGETWWLQPFVSAGHSWLKIDKHDVAFIFKDLTTGEETPSQATVSTERIKSLWQAGVGVEKKIKRWTFGVSAEMQKDFSNPKDVLGNSVASNFGILRGGVKFNIF